MQILKTTSITLFLSFFISLGCIQAQQVWSLQDCIRYALDNNIYIKQQMLGVEIASENLSQSRANRFPSLNASASHGYYFGRTIDPFTNEFATETIRTNNFNASSNVTLFSGFQINNAIRQSFIEMQASYYDVELIQNDISLAVASAYLQILFAKELVEIATNQLDITNQQVDRTRRLVDAGTLALGNLLTIEAQAATEELQLVNAQNNLDISYLNLVQLLDLEVMEDFMIEIPDINLHDVEQPFYSPMQIYLDAVLIQPQILSSELRIESAELGLSIARGARSPVLSLSGNYGSGYSGAARDLTQPGAPVIPFWEQMERNLNYSAGIFLSIPIFNRYQVRSAIGRSIIAVDNARYNNQLVRNELFKTIQQSHADAQAALKRYDATLKNVKALEEAFRYSEQRFNVGMVAPVEYNDAKNRLTTAQSDLLQAKYEYVFRTQVLRFYMGYAIEL
jgi:outer membrane protein